MKILFFITYATLGLNHAKICLYELMLSLKKCSMFNFDCMYIYNTHKEELPNEIILDIIDKYKLNKYISDISVFPHNDTTFNISIIFDFCKRNYSKEDKIFILESDILLSNNIINNINKIISKSFVFVPPIVNNKNNISNNQLHSYCNKDIIDHKDIINKQFPLYLTIDCIEDNLVNYNHILTSDTSFIVYNYFKNDVTVLNKKKLLICITGYIRTFNKTFWSFITLLKQLYKKYDIDLVISTYYIQYNYHPYIKGVLNFNSEKIVDNDLFINIKKLFQPLCNNVEIIVNEEDTSYTDLPNKTKEIYHGYLANNRIIDCILFNYAMSNEYDTVIKTRFDCVLDYIEIGNCISYINSLQNDDCLIVSGSSNPVNDHIYICKHNLFIKLIEHIQYRYINPRDIDTVDPPHGFTQSFIIDNNINLLVKHLVKIIRFLKFTIISHRGNLDGPCKENENKPCKIDNVIQHGFDVEVDVRYINEELWLGHDEAQYKIDYDYLFDRRNNLWIHCKDGESLKFFNNKNKEIDNFKFNYFYHTDEDYVLTSNGTVWTYPGVKIISENSVCVMSDDYDIAKYICTDYPIRCKNN